MSKKSKRKKDSGAFRSKLEKNFAEFLAKIGWSFLYEPLKLPYIVPAKNRTYTPDFIIDLKNKRRIATSLTLEELKDLDTLVVIETKGRFTAPDRAKTLYVLDHNPWLRRRFVMVFPQDNYLTSKKNKKNPESGMRYSTWCEKHGVKYFIGQEPTRKQLKEIVENG